MREKIEKVSVRKNVRREELMRDEKTSTGKRQTVEEKSSE